MLRVVPNEAIILLFYREFCFGFSPKYFFFREKAKASTPGKTGLLSFSVFSKRITKFRYKGVEDRVAAPLELCLHSRAHETK